MGFFFILSAKLYDVWAIELILSSVAHHHLDYN